MNNIDEDIERCKELIKNRHKEWIGMTNQKAIGNVLQALDRNSAGDIEVTDEKNMNFGQAIQRLKDGMRVQREGWNGKNQYIELAERVAYINAKGEIINEGHSDIGNKVIAFVGTSGVQLGWLASQADMLAEDWKIVD